MNCTVNVCPGISVLISLSIDGSQQYLSKFTNFYLQIKLKGISKLNFRCSFIRIWSCWMMWSCDQTGDSYIVILTSEIYWMKVKGCKLFTLCSVSETFIVSPRQNFMFTRKIRDWSSICPGTLLNISHFMTIVEWYLKIFGRFEK